MNENFLDNFFSPASNYALRVKQLLFTRNAARGRFDTAELSGPPVGPAGVRKGSVASAPPPPLLVLRSCLVADHLDRCWPSFAFISLFYLAPDVKEKSASDRSSSLFLDAYSNTVGGNNSIKVVRKSFDQGCSKKFRSRLFETVLLKFVRISSASVCSKQFF
jgi:hypothetical protein